MASNPNTPIHPSFDERISVQVEGQLPDFVKQDHATFVAFLEAYYEYMELLGKPYEIISNLDNYFNVDKTVDDYLKYFKNQFGKDVPEAIFVNANKPQVLKKLRDFYRSKGSEKSFQFLFRLLYKEEIEFYYPGSDMLRVSDGKYSSDKILRCVDNSGTDVVAGFLGKTITGATSTANGVVELVLNEYVGPFNVSTIYLSKVVGTFQSLESVSDGTNSVNIDGMVTGYTITKPGNGYSIEDNVTITGGGGSAVGAQFLVDALTTGSITTHAIPTAGTGYVVGDKLTINNTDKLEIDGRTCSILVKTVNGSGGITTIEFEHRGYGYIGIPTVSGGTGNGASITLGGDSIGGIASLKLTKNGFRYREIPTLDFSNIGDGTATGTATIGGYEDKHATRWIGDDGFISAANYIQDSYYYQVFSYEIKSGHSIADWKPYVTRLVHPAGLALFGRSMITSLLSTSLAMSPGEKDPHLRTPYVHTFPYKIIFHDGDIEPPVRLNVQLQGNGTADPFEEWPTGGVWPHDGQANGPGLGPGHSEWHIYEIDVPIILLTSADSDDYEFILHAVPVGQEYEYGTSGSEGSPGTTTESEDWGFVTGGIGGALVLGPLKRQIDQQKFNKEGGFSKSSYLQGGSGYTSGTISVTLSGGGSPSTQAVLTPIIDDVETYNGTVTGAVTGFTVANAGAGYTSTPIITITDSGSGSGAVAKAQTTGTIAYSLNYFGDGLAHAAVPGVVTGGYVVQESHASLMRDGVKSTETGTLSACPHQPPHGEPDILSGGTQNFYALPKPPGMEDLGGGYTIQHFKDLKISTYITNKNEKTRIVMNSDITLV